ncbi:hypothetical protein SAMN04487911_102220 [Arenibacter nanhaiticus]|uniref:Uncharacterized protein n=1 Tax=Arenibacter nanhaiticus TaxID=558155 RepID=A0A1M6BIQ4_9FLAO|nr:hypothetical protein SAMN04487911_102220 [Arenibacter nanhaiticus]
MFSTGQLIFAGLFFIAFVIITFFAYNKDKSLHLKNYKGIKWIALTFVSFIIILFIIKFFLKP